MASRPPSPAHTADPSARWEQLRQQWNSPSPPSLFSNSPSLDAAPNGQPALPSGRRQRDPLFHQRIATLEQMLRAANAGPSGSRAGVAAVPSLLSVPAVSAAAAGADSGAGSSGSHATVVGDKGKGKAADEPEEPDGGDVVGAEREGDAKADQVRELKKVSEGIFLAFKQNRALKEPLPLSLVTSLLYRSWTLDGTIPTNYDPRLASAGDAMPVPRSYLSSPAHFAASPSPAGTSSAVPSPAPAAEAAAAVLAPAASPAPSLLAALAEKNSNAVTPLPSSPSSGPTTPASAPHVEDTAGEMPPPPVPTTAQEKPDPAPLQSAPDLQGMGARGESGKLQLDMMRGSRWRTERDVASGSDVI
ncbi:hypothetical protein JCM10213_001475 [Rhodosporidiobolus nylandii]